MPKGGAPLTINSVSVPEGFSYKISATENGEAATFPYEVAALGKAYLTVTMDASMVGKRSGNIVITPADGQGEVYTLAVTGEIVDPSKVYINFNDQKFLPAPTSNCLLDKRNGKCLTSLMARTDMPLQATRWNCQNSCFRKSAWLKAST